MNKVAKWLKKYFIPGEHNDHKPHMLRTEVAMFFFAVILLVEVVFLLQVAILHSNTGYFAQVLPSVIAGLTNDNRQVDNLPGLRVNEVLQRAAQMKADDMAQKGYFAHNSPDGITPWHWIDEAGYAYEYAGENLAINFIDSSDVNKAWMDSPAHRKNILNANFTEIGIATANGVYEGKETTFIVQVFGRPAKKAEEKKPIVAVSAQENGKEDGQPVVAPLVLGVVLRPEEPQDFQALVGARPAVQAGRAGGNELRGGLGATAYWGGA